MRHLIVASVLIATSIAAIGGDGAANRVDDVPTYGYDVVNTWPHDPNAYTQGLTVKDGVLYESTGRYGASSLRIVDLATGRIEKSVNLPAKYFGEGIAVLGDRLFQLTWREHIGFIYDRHTLARLGEFSYDGEGWGLTTDGRSLILSDGTDRLRFLDAQSFRVHRTLKVRDRGEPLRNLNELELVNGEILANVWQSNAIARIDPDTGQVRGWIDLRGLLNVDTADAVLNGIAYDEARDRLFVTGKLWPALFQIRLRQPDRH
ncbi:MAG: glutamine cyclotransferase [Candidatus Muproteobacteria bacterium RBG_16_60_9]|uniref:Glutamine cyclotransferase n=1 Tax=Candidatus Muproteobacteria bacterium RBG_16_60_9 TaxID=1817755 RepID=A0A1F6UVX6_9PROT|nr:MAG: glutamine cyclotransferase [Candidatus Muproteobacteria bacterium RBG_16_60_9]